MYVKMLFLFRSAPEVKKRIHSKHFRKFWRSRGTKEPAYITVLSHNPLLGITWRCQPAKILHNRSSFFHRKSSRIMDLTLVKKAAMRTVWLRH